MKILNGKEEKSNFEFNLKPANEDLCHNRRHISHISRSHKSPTKFVSLSFLFSNCLKFSQVENPTVTQRSLYFKSWGYFMNRTKWWMRWKFQSFIEKIFWKFSLLRSCRKWKTSLKGNTREKNSLPSLIFSLPFIQFFHPIFIHTSVTRFRDFRYSEFIFYLFSNLCCLTPPCSLWAASNSKDKTEAFYTAKTKNTQSS